MRLVLVTTLAAGLLSGANCPVIQIQGAGMWTECGQQWKDTPSNYKSASTQELVTVGQWRYQIVREEQGLRYPTSAIYEIAVSNVGSNTLPLPPISVIGRKRRESLTLYFEYQPLNPADALPKAIIYNPQVVLTPEGPGLAPNRNGEGVTIPRPLETTTPFSPSEKRDGWLGFACCDNTNAEASWLRVSDGHDSVLIRLFDLFAKP